MKKIEVTLSSLTLCNPMHCRLAGFNVHGILKARILEGIAISFPNSAGQLQHTP